MLPRKRKKHKLRKYIFILILFFLVSFVLVFFALHQKFLKNKLSIISPLGEKDVDSEKNLEKDLTKAGIGYSSITTDYDSSYVIELLNGGQVIITPGKNVNIQISSLQLITSRLTIEGKKFSKIDFRFDKPIITF